jgi:hypothetical protein
VISDAPYWAATIALLALGTGLTRWAIRTHRDLRKGDQ